MAAFPQLKTGAVAQYPSHRSLTFSTRRTRFLDGSEQRFRDYPAPLHCWAIQLDQLDEAEVAAIQDFFVAQQGELGDFSFTDPWDGVEYPSCSIDSDRALREYLASGRGCTTLVVRENRS